MNDQAIKLFEALSGVDETLLERCNRKEEKRPAKFFLRYGRAMAACVCLIVVGAAAWGGYRLITGPASASDSSAAGQSMNTSTALLNDMAPPMDGGNCGGVAEIKSEAESESRLTASSSSKEQVSGQGQMTSGSAAASKDVEQMPAQGAQSQVAESLTSEGAFLGDGLDANRYSAGAKLEEQLAKENMLTDSRQIIPWDEACSLEPFCRYLPTVLPTGYEPLVARQSSNPDLWDNIIFKWGDGRQVLCLNMTLGEAKTKEDLDKLDGIDQYLAEGFQKEMIPENGPDGQILFTLYYADGMRIDFSGYVTADEMWDVVESVAK